MTLTAGQERSLAIKVKASYDLRAVTFSANGEHLLSGGLNQNVQVWQVHDGQRVATVEGNNVLCLAVSRNGKWIAGGTRWGNVFVWDETYKSVWMHCEDSWIIEAVDFSPDSTKLVLGSSNYTATIWDAASGEKIRTLLHEQGLRAAKFSSDDDRIATATYKGSIRVWDSKDGHLLVDIPVMVTSLYNSGLLWFNNHIFVVSDNTIKQLDASTGSTVYEYPVPNSGVHSSITIPRHGNFIAYSTNRSVTFWDASTHLQIGLVKHTEDIHSFALSPGDRSLAIGGCHGTIITEGLSHFIVSTYPHWTMTCLMACSSLLSFRLRLHFTLQGSDIQIDDAALDAWKNNQLEDAEALLTTAMHQHQHPRYHFLAARALVRARLQRWDEALVDAQMVLLA